jgi:hypothetical protein
VCVALLAVSAHDASAESLQVPRGSCEVADLRDLPRSHTGEDAGQGTHSWREALAVRGAPFGRIHARQRGAGLRRHASAHVASTRLSHACEVASARGASEGRPRCRDSLDSSATRLLCVAPPTRRGRGMLCSWRWRARDDRPTSRAPRRRPCEASEHPHNATLVQPVPLAATARGGYPRCTRCVRRPRSRPASPGEPGGRPSGHRRRPSSRLRR